MRLTCHARRSLVEAKEPNGLCVSVTGYIAGFEEGTRVSTTSNKRQLASGISALAIALAGTIAVPTAAWAQAGTSTLRGHAAAGTEVIATDVATGAVRQTSSSSRPSIVTGDVSRTAPTTGGGSLCTPEVFDAGWACAERLWVLTQNATTARLHVAERWRRDRMRACV